MRGGILEKLVRVIRGCPTCTYKETTKSKKGARSEQKMSQR